MSQIGKREAVGHVFKVIELMEKLRDVFRRTAPTHTFTPSEREEALKLIGQAKTALDKMEKSF